MTDILSVSEIFQTSEDMDSWLIQDSDLFKSAKAIKQVLETYNLKPTYFRIAKKHFLEAFVKTRPSFWTEDDLFGFDAMAKVRLSEVPYKKYKVSVDNYNHKTNFKYSMFLKWHSFLTDIPKEYITPFSFRTTDEYPFVDWHPGGARRSFLQYLPDDTIIKLMIFDRGNSTDDIYANRLKDVLAQEIGTQYSHHSLSEKTENEIYKIMEMGTKWNTQEGAKTLISYNKKQQILEISQPFNTVAPTKSYQIDTNDREIWVNDTLLAYKINGIWRPNTQKYLTFPEN